MKKTKIKWFIPCFFNRGNGSDEEIIFNITESVKTIFSNDTSNKKVEYGFNFALKNIKSSDFEEVNIKIFPRFIQGYINTNRINNYIEANNKIYKYFNANSYKTWNYNIGVVCIEVLLNNKIKSIPTRNQIKNFDFDTSFLDSYHIFLALFKEISALFLSGIHLTYPTRSIMISNDHSINDGILHISSFSKNFYTNFETSDYMHHVLIDEKRLESLKSNITGLSKVWHCNLWSLKRYLIAVKSNSLDMDNMLDLIYSLEGLFEKNTSSDFIKLFCIAKLCVNRNEALLMKNKLDLVFKLRNDITHGGKYYRGYEKLNLNGKEILSQDLYWGMKEIVSTMLVHAINKLIKDRNMKNLVFKTDDFFQELYDK